MKKYEKITTSPRASIDILQSIADRNEHEDAMLRLIEGSSDQSDEGLLARRLVGTKDTIRLLEEEVDRLGLMVTPVSLMVMAPPLITR